MKKCPYCAEEIQDEAQKCKYCGEFLSEPKQYAQKDSNTARCPKCGSSSIQAVKKGFNAGDACSGLICCGPAGALLGAAESNKLSNVCLNCGNTWELKLKEQSACMAIWDCHRLPERSFHFHGKQMPLCSRCAGLLLGLFISIALISAHALPALWVSLFFVIVMLTDWSLQRYLHIMSNNPRRLVTGTICGIGMSSVLCHMVSILFNTALI